MIALALVAIAALVGAWLIDRRRRVYADLGTTPAAAVSAGRNEVKGRAWHAEPLISHLTRTPCVSWSFLLEEERRHTRTVNRTDANGKTSTHTETYTEWHDIESLGSTHEHFEVIDETGSVRIVPANASLTLRQMAREVFRQDDDRGFLARTFSLDNRTGRYRKTEELIAVGDELFVVGEASLRDDVGEPQLDHGSPFLVSTRSEESHRTGLGVFVPVLVVVAIGSAALAGQAVRPGPGGAVLGAGAVLLVVLGATAFIVYNRLQLVAQQAARAWSLIGVQLLRRHDLIPRLAAVTREALGHEREVVEATTEARSRLLDHAPDRETVDRADQEAREQTRRLTALWGIVEGYPGLKANATVDRLRHELADTENRIAGAREFYNHAVTILSNRRRTFPGVLVARWADPRQFALFSAEGFERTVPAPTFAFPT